MLVIEFYVPQTAPMMVQCTEACSTCNTVLELADCFKLPLGFTAAEAMHSPFPSLMCYTVGTQLSCDVTLQVLHQHVSRSQLLFQPPYQGHLGPTDGFPLCLSTPCVGHTEGLHCQHVCRRNFWMIRGKYREVCCRGKLNSWREIQCGSVHGTSFYGLSIGGIFVVVKCLLLTSCPVWCIFSGTDAVGLR